MSSTKRSTNKTGKVSKAKTKGKTPKQIMTRHINDEKAIITEEEFKNLDLRTDVAGQDTNEPLELPEGNEGPKDKAKDHGTITPWDVIE